MKYENITMIPNVHSEIRYALTKDGSNPLLVIGLNPSTANETKPDNTMKSVLRIASYNNYDGFVMLNLYPLRSTCPAKLPEQSDTEIYENNIHVIKDILEKYPESDILLAYGNNIIQKKYLRQYAEEIIKMLREMGRNILCIGVTKCGMPKHPLYASSNSALKPYPIK